MAHAMTLNAYAQPARQGGVIHRFLEAVADYRAYARIRGELNALSERQLADIGVSRREIRDLAETSVYGR